MNKDLYSHLPIGSRVKDAKGRVLTLVEKKDTGWLFFRAIEDGSLEPFAYRFDGQPDCDPHSAPLVQILYPTFAELREGSLFVTQNGSLCEVVWKGQAGTVCGVWEGGHANADYRGSKSRTNEKAWTINREKGDGYHALCTYYTETGYFFGVLDYLRPANDEETARVEKRRRELEGTPAEAPRQDVKNLLLVCGQGAEFYPNAYSYESPFRALKLCLSPSRTNRVFLRYSLDVCLLSEGKEENIAPALAEVLREKKGPFGVFFTKNGESLPLPSWSLAPEGSPSASLVFEQFCTFDASKKNEFGLTLTDPFLSALRALCTTFPSVQLKYDFLLYQPRT